MAALTLSLHPRLPPQLPVSIPMRFCLVNDETMKVRYSVLWCSSALA